MDYQSLLDKIKNFGNTILPTLKSEDTTETLDLSNLKTPDYSSLFRQPGEPSPMDLFFKPDSDIKKITESGEKLSEQLQQKISTPVNKTIKWFTEAAPREIAYPAAKGFLGETLYNKLIKPIIPKGQETPIEPVIPKISEMAGKLTLVNALAKGFGIVVSGLPEWQKLITHAPKVAQVIQDTIGGLTADQLQQSLNQTIEERRKIFWTGLPQWLGYGIAGATPIKQVYTWLPSAFMGNYLSAKLAGKNNHEAFKDALNSTAIMSAFKLLELPKDPLTIAKEQAEQTLGVDLKTTSYDEINKKYYELAHQYHPDKGGDPEMFKAITASRDLLLELKLNPRSYVETSIWSEIKDLYRYYQTPEGKGMAIQLLRDVPVGLTVQPIQPASENDKKADEIFNDEIKNAKGLINPETGETIKDITYDKNTGEYRAMVVKPALRGQKPLPNIFKTSDKESLLTFLDGYNIQETPEGNTQPISIKDNIIQRLSKLGLKLPQQHTTLPPAELKESGEPEETEETIPLEEIPKEEQLVEQPMDIGLFTNPSDIHEFATRIITEDRHWSDKDIEFYKEHHNEILNEVDRLMKPFKTKPKIPQVLQDAVKKENKPEEVIKQPEQTSAPETQETQPTIPPKSQNIVEETPPQQQNNQIITKSELTDFKKVLERTDDAHVWGKKLGKILYSHHAPEGYYSVDGYIFKHIPALGRSSLLSRPPKNMQLKVTDLENGVTGIWTFDRHGILQSKTPVTEGEITPKPVSEGETEETPEPQEQEQEIGITEKLPELVPETTEETKPLEKEPEQNPEEVSPEIQAEDEEYAKILEQESNQYQKEEGKKLFDAIKSAGKIRVSEEEKEELSKIPKELLTTDPKAGLPYDMMIANLNEEGYNIKSLDDLINRISKYKTGNEQVTPSRIEQKLEEFNKNKPKLTPEEKAKQNALKKLSKIERDVYALGGLDNPDIVKDLNEIGGYNFKDKQELLDTIHAVQKSTGNKIQPLSPAEKTAQSKYLEKLHKDIEEELNKGKTETLLTQNKPITSAVIDKIKSDLEKTKLSNKSAKFGELLRSYIVGERDLRIAETNQLRDQLQKILTPREQEALTFYRDFKGNETELANLLNDPTFDRYKQVINLALHPTDAMLKADQEITKYHQKTLQEGRELGFLDSTISDEKYITHLLAPSEEEPYHTGIKKAPISRTTPFAKTRTYDTVADAIKAGVKVKTINALDALTIYGQKHAIAASTRLFVNQLKDSTLAKWGFSGSENIPSDWVPLDPSNKYFRNTIPFTDSEGKPSFAYQDLYVPKPVADALQPLLQTDFTGTIPGFRNIRVYQSYIKAAELSLSVFHIRALNLTAMNNMGRKEWLRSLSEDMTSQLFLENEKDFIQHGGQTPILGRTIEAYKGLEDTSVPSRTDILKHLPLIKQVDSFAKGLTEFTFNHLQRTFKVHDYSFHVAQWIAQHPNASELELDLAKRSIAKEINAAYGGLNWEALGLSKATVNIARFFTLAPDWTYSNILTAKYAFEGGPGGAASRNFWIMSVITGIVFNYLTNAFIRRIRGEPPPKPNFQNLTSVYLGKDKYGKNIYQSIYFAGAPQDTINLINNIADYGVIQGFAQTLASKASPFVKVGIQALTNRNYLGQEIVPRGMGPVAGTARAAYVYGSDLLPVPFSLSTIAQMFLDPKKQYTMPEYILSLMGTRPRHLVPKGMKEITSGARKGYVEPAAPQIEKPFWEQVTTGKQYESSSGLHSLKYHPVRYHPLRYRK